MRKIFSIMTVLFLAIGVANAETKSVPNSTISAPSDKVQTSATPLIAIGLPINTSGISVANQPDVLNFVTINTDNSTTINWKNVCQLTSKHKLNVQTDLQNVKGEALVFLLPYILQSSNPTSCTNK